MANIADDPSQWMNVPKAKTVVNDGEPTGFSNDSAVLDYYSLRYALNRIVEESAGRHSNFAQLVHSLAMGALIATKKRGCTK